MCAALMQDQAGAKTRPLCGICRAADKVVSMPSPTTSRLVTVLDGHNLMAAVVVGPYA